MGRKRKKMKPIIFCYYCDRDFDNEKVLIQHQKAKHYKCTLCHRRLGSAQGMMVHVSQVHKQTIDRVPYAKPGKDSFDINVFGMTGVPEEAIEAKRAERGEPPSKKVRTNGSNSSSSNAAGLTHSDLLNGGSSTGLVPNAPPLMNPPMFGGSAVPSAMAAPPSMMFPPLMNAGPMGAFPLPGMYPPMMMPGMVGFPQPMLPSVPGMNPVPQPAQIPNLGQPASMVAAAAPVSTQPVSAVTNAASSAPSSTSVAPASTASVVSAAVTVPPPHHQSAVVSSVASTPLSGSMSVHKQPALGSVASVHSSNPPSMIHSAVPLITPAHSILPSSVVAAPISTTATAASAVVTPAAATPTSSSNPINGAISSNAVVEEAKPKPIKKVKKSKGVLLYTDEYESPEEKRWKWMLSLRKNAQSNHAAA